MQVTMNEERLAMPTRKQWHAVLCQLQLMILRSLTLRGPAKTSPTPDLVRRLALSSLLTVDTDTAWTA